MNTLTIAAAKQYRRIGNIPGCLLLKACDIGEAVLADGRHVYITWGRNLSDEDCQKLADTVTDDFVRIGPDCECILRDDHAQKLLSIITRDKSAWIPA